MNQRLSLATVYSPEHRYLATSEADLPDINNINTLNNNDNFVDIIGQNNLSEHIMATDGGSIEDVDGLLRDTEQLKRWHMHLIGREIAVRAIEASVVGGVELSRSRVEAFLQTVAAISGYDTRRRRLWSSKSLNVGAASKAVKKALDAEFSLGDGVARARAITEGNMGANAYLMSHKYVNGSGIPYGTRIKAKGVGPLLEKVTKEISESTDESTMLNNDIRLMHAKLGLEAIGNKYHTDQLPLIQDAISHVEEMRKRPHRYDLPLEGETSYRYFPSNVERFGYKYPETDRSQVEEKPRPRRESIVLRRQPKDTTNEDLEAERRKREAREAEIAEHDAPILAELARLRGEYEQDVATFVGQDKKTLRERGLAGKNSLGYRVGQAIHDDIDKGNRIARVYDALCSIAANSDDDNSDPKEILGGRYLRLIEKRQEYEEYLKGNPLKNGALNQLDRLSDDISDEIAWLTDNWTRFCAIVETSAHGEFANQKTLETIRGMLGVETTDTEHEDAVDQRSDDDVLDGVSPEEVSGNGAVDTESESSLAEANRLIEQLDWVVFPDESITAEYLIKTARDQVNEMPRGNARPRVVEEYRMEGLLALREEFGGTLYRSGDRLLDDSNNLYFVLRFQRPGDKNTYVVAENPVYGNATYVLREDLLPLMPGETALSALKVFRRRSIRELGAERIVHGGQDCEESHLSKIHNTFKTLSSQ